MVPQCIDRRLFVGKGSDARVQVLVGTGNPLAYKLRSAGRPGLRHEIPTPIYEPEGCLQLAQGILDLPTWVENASSGGEPLFRPLASQASALDSTSAITP